MGEAYILHLDVRSALGAMHLFHPAALRFQSCAPLKPSFGVSGVSGRCRALSLKLEFKLYFNLAPTGTSSKNPANTGLPPSSDAATIIPFDSSPRSLRGARLATITTLRPTSGSGS